MKKFVGVAIAAMLAVVLFASPVGGGPGKIHQNYRCPQVNCII